MSEQEPINNLQLGYILDELALFYQKPNMLRKNEEKV